MNGLPGVGLRGEITLNLFLFVAMMTVMVAFVLFDISGEGVAFQRIEDKRGVVESIVGNIEGTLKSDPDLARIAHEKSFLDFLSSCRQARVFDAARLFGPDGNDLLRVGTDDGSLADGNRARDASNAMGDRRLITSVDREGKHFFRESWGDVLITAPVQASGRVVGGFQMVSPVTQPGDGVLHYNWHLLVLLIAFSLLIVTLISYSLGQEVVRPIEEILNATKSVKQGNLEQRVTVKSNNEIGRLAASFNDMVDELKGNREKVTEHLRSLKEVNQRLQQAEHHALRTEKLAAIGRIAAGVAHEVGNPLGALYGYLEVLKKKLSSDEEIELIDKIERETNRINEIIFSLLDLSRQERGTAAAVRVNELIEKTMSLLASQNALAGIDSQLHLKLDLPELKGDPRELQQALINVLANAIEAMPSGGVLTIRSGTTAYQGIEEAEVEEPPRRESDPSDIDFSPLRRRRQESPDGALRQGQEVVFIEISDTGKGIKREHLPKIFEPFFTLKDQDREPGVGLGLAICDRIVRGMGGIVRVDSVWGKGSTFTFYLPTGGKPAGERSETAGIEDRNRESRSES